MSRPILRLDWGALAPAPSRVAARYLGVDRAAAVTGFALPDAPLAGFDLTLHDAGTAPVGPAPQARLWHVLWVRDEAAATVRVGDATWPIAPGDTVPVPAGAAFATTGGQLALIIASPTATAAPDAPTHGTDHFHGHNRRTDAATLGDLRLRRWKLTQPLDLADHYRTPVVVLALARPVVIRTSEVIEQLRQGEAALIDPAARPTVAPDGLAYLLTLDRPPRDA